MAAMSYSRGLNIVATPMSIVSKPVKLAGSTLTHSCHACAFFHTKEEEYSVLMPFIQDGFENGDRAAHIVNPALRAAHMERLEQAGIDTAAAETRGQLEVRTWDETYLQEGHFDQYRMIDTLLKMIDPAKAPSGKISRIVASMSWALEDRPGVDDIVEYETRLNQALPAQHDPVVCTYDLAQFDATVVIDILRTHPMVIIGGILQENPFFIPAEQMLAELEARKAASSMSSGAAA